MFDILTTHALSVNLKKCHIGCTQLEFLGHYIFQEGIMADKVKVEAIRGWEVHKNFKALKGFLGLTRYDQRFVKNYNSIASPLMALLKKYEFT